eukprot:5591711-Amphidinium_carterae.1
MVCMLQLFEQERSTGGGALSFFGCFSFAVERRILMDVPEAIRGIFPSTTRTHHDQFPIVWGLPRTRLHTQDSKSHDNSRCSAAGCRRGGTFFLIIAVTSHSSQN